MVHFAFLNSAGQEIASHDESLRGSQALARLYAVKARNHVELLRINASSIARVVVSDDGFEMNIDRRDIFGVDLT